eukprot:CAMPEP_0197578516 /NCGR_PEP_ID=MMETSP1326-20131121/2694_1 /TAXON_ID=1155430 /ORGANISM="Genus nov. species nov., Strain RCC2288" /LENGTH=186 /DNA_ID=CAMNT_0043141701 /DNA_START=57 /DNA_END=613 /DNA_ORIENTATION=+
MDAWNPFKSSSGASFAGKGKTLGTKADDEEKKQARLAALEGKGGASGSGGAGRALGTQSTDDMRREMLAEREKRRAVAAAAVAKEKAERDAALQAEDADDPAMAPIADAVRRIAADPNRDASAALLLKMMANIVADPGNGKFRRLRMANKKVAAAVLETDGGLQLLEAVGFLVVVDEEAEGAAAVA